tara:strand:- start:1531 stop:1983 length:453 start_codon:yes stop_codon:yes gene_type:complete
MDNSSILLTNTVGAVGLGTTRPPTFKNVNDVEIGTLCSAWLVWDTYGGHSIVSDFNVSGITDGGVGITSVFFEKSLPLGMNQGSSRYAFSGTAQTESNRSQIILSRAATGDPTNQMTDTMLYVRTASSGSDQNLDSNYNSLIVFANGNVT